jgi:hypothetical protein
MREFLNFLYGNEHGLYIRYASLEIKPNKTIIPKYKYTKNIENLLKLEGKKDRYMSIALRKNNKVNTQKGVAYTNVLFMDLDFHEYSETQALKERAIKALDNDVLLCQYSCIVDSGRGIHVYYKLPEPLYREEFKQAQKILIDYAFGVKFVKGCVDNNAKDVSRILRLPGTINSKTGTHAVVVGEIKDEPVDDLFMKMTKEDRSKAKGSKYSVKQAWELCGLGEIPEIDENISCPFPNHEDEKPSFKYFAESDTFWCYGGCSINGPAKKYNGIHFLELMGRKELIPQLKQISQIESKLGYYMRDGGKLYFRTDKKETFVCDFMSENRIEATTFQRRVFIDLGDDAIEITDFPSNKDIKQRYLQAGREFFLNESGAKVADILVKFIKLSNLSDKSVVFNPGLNKYKNGEETFYMNGIVYPQVNKEFIPICENVDRVETDDVFDINEFIKNLIKDDNYTHIVGLLWAVASTARDIFIKKSGMFPLLVATGIRESGKTMLGRLITSMFGYSMSEELDTTSFAMLKKLVSYGSLPIHFDEFGDKYREKEHNEIIKDISTSVIVKRERGTATQETNKYFIQCPVIITGEKHIVDAGMGSRGIVLNLGRNKHGDDDAFDKWSEDVIELNTVQFMEIFLARYWKTFRKVINKLNHSRRRSSVKKNIILMTLSFLEKVRLIEPGLIDPSKIKQVITLSDKYNEALSCDVYSEIMSDVFSIDYDPNKNTENDHYVKQMDTAINFDIEHGVVLVNPTVLYQMYLDSTAGMQKKMTRQQFGVAFHQAPDFLHVKDSKKRVYITNTKTKDVVVKRNKAFVMSVSQYNKEYLKIALMYKLQYNEDVVDVHDKAEKYLNDMIDMDHNHLIHETKFEVI